MSEPEEEADVDVAPINSLTPEDIRRTILGSPYHQDDLEWDTRDINVEGTGETDCAGLRSKRQREESSNEGSDGFIVVTGKKRRNLRRSCSSPHAEASSICEVSVRAKTALPKQFGFAKLLRGGDIQGVQKVTYKSPFRLLIYFMTEKDADVFLNWETIREREWVCRKSHDVVFSYGVVRDVDIDIEDKELGDVIESDLEIVSIKRLLKKDEDGKWVRCETIRLCFKGSVLPPYVKAYGSRMNVDSYMYPVTQCTKCWRFGHIKRFCPSKAQICPKCGEKHDCCDTTVFKCVNCKGGHMSIIKSACPTFHRERKIRIYMGQNNCSYKEALQKLTDEKRAEQNNQAEQDEQCPPSGLNPLISAGNLEQEKSYRDVCAGISSEDKQLETSDMEECNPQPIGPRSQQKKKRRKKVNGNLNKSRHEEDEVTDSEDLVVNEEEPDQERNQKERKSLIKKMITKLTEILFSESSFQIKFENCIKIIWTEIKNFLERNVTGGMLLKLVGIQNG